MNKFEQDQMRTALDVVNRLKNACINEPGSTANREALITTVKHYNMMGFAFKLTREVTQIRRVLAKPLHS